MNAPRSGRPLRCAVVIAAVMGFVASAAAQFVWDGTTSLAATALGGTLPAPAFS